MKKWSCIGGFVKKILTVGVGGVAIGFILMVTVYILPTEPMRMNVQRSAEEWHDEGAWPLLINGYSSSILDNFTDSLILSIAVFDNGELFLKEAMNNSYAMQSVESLPFDSLYAYLQDEDCYGEDYARYWHGYLVVVKPLLLLFSYSDLRVLNMCALTCLLIYVSYLLRKNVDKYVDMLFVLVFLFLMPLTLFLCLDMANMFYVTLFAVIVLLKKKDYWQKDNNILIFFLSVGMLTSYMDFLTYPIITLGIPLATYLAMTVGQNRQKVCVWYSVLASFMWVLGYGGMWGAKWILASLISGENIILNALRTVKTRSGLRTEDDVLLSRVKAIGTNLDVLTQGVYGKILAVLGVMLVVFLIWSILRRKTCMKWIGAFVFVALIPFVWVFVTSEHASIHSWFTYRNFVVTIYSLGMMCICAHRNEQCEGMKE